MLVTMIYQKPFGQKGLKFCGSMYREKSGLKQLNRHTSFSNHDPQGVKRLLKNQLPRNA